MLTVSIIIPAWNESRRILAALRNATTQTVKAHEIIVIDNNSTDNTYDLVQGFIDSHPDDNVILRKQSKIQGLIPTRNYGFEIATGDIVGRIDADCMLKPNWVEVVSRFFSAYPDVDGTTGPVCYYDEPLPPLGQWGDNLVREKQYNADGMMLLFGSNMAVRRSVWDKIKNDVCLDSKDVYHEDIDFSLHMFDHGLKTRYCSEMVTGASARRMGTPYASFKAYMQRFETTFNAHPTHKRGGYPEKTLLKLYPFLHTLWMVYGAWTSIFKIDTTELLWKSYRERVHLD